MGSGQSQTPGGLDNVVKRAQSRAGHLTVSGRYHKQKKLSDDYAISKKGDSVLGHGYNGQVYKASRKDGAGEFAVKGFKLLGVPKEKRDELEVECEIFLAMDHPHVARLVDVYQSQEQLDLVMECMSGGELFKRVQKQKRFSEKIAANAVYQMLLAVNYIHSHGIVHRDIKLENFLYEKDDGDHLKLIDFGFSKIWKPDTTMRLSCGTLAYVAPEVLSESYTNQCDLWSLGVTVFIMLAGYMPFAGSEEKQIKDIKAGRYRWQQEKWQNVSPVAIEFVKALLDTDPDKRLNAQSALEHPFIVNREKAADVELDDGIVSAIVNFGQASAFRRCCMSMMAWSLTNDERAMVRNAFIEMDQDHTGSIKLWEFKKVLEEKCHINNDEATKLFKALDTNHTDEIHYSEFLAAMVSTRINMHDDLIKSTFKRFDTDNSGKITADNLREVLGETFDGITVEQIMKEADITHSGDISYEEWILYLKSSSGAENTSDMAARLIDQKFENDAERSRMMKIKTEIAKESASQNRQAKKQSCCAVM